jgi:murein DD-endopeptidase MepM/ murein hydrolase activator NlpD
MERFVLHSLCAVLFLNMAAAGAQSPAYPEIKRLGQSDVVFRQYEDEVRAGRRVFAPVTGIRPTQRLSPSSWAERLSIYSYRTRDDDAIDDTIQSVASRCVVTQASIATLNRIPHNAGLDGRVLLLPTVSGVFVPAAPRSDMERLLLSARDPSNGVEIIVSGAVYLFFPGDDFSPTERAFFFSEGRFQFPLRNYTVTSRFGSRVSPVSGTVRFHGGLDLAAPMGTNVYASGTGKVLECGENPVYGVFVIVQHENNWTSLYGHLSAVTVREGELVDSGGLLGRVGSTGQSTGPHLHFELRQNGRAADPAALLKR